MNIIIFIGFKIDEQYRYLIMNKITFLGLVFIINFINIYPAEPEKMVFDVNQEVEFFFKTKPPYSPTSDEFKWQNEDEWKLIKFDENVFTVLSYDASAPNWCGNSLLQRWTFKANRTGSFNFVFKKYSDEKIIQVTITGLTGMDRAKQFLASFFK
ncbi:MAG: hypothetical protein P4L22_05130 [Candidatus Babeliales bacterium]|nr:hypothetical protein [Candidatus Babeliales bacterium]